MEQNTPMNNKNSALRVRSRLMAGKITVYGQDTCKWTVKQKDYLTDKGIEFDYIDCSKQSCPSFVSAFPTLMMDGVTHTGFKEV